MCFVGLARRRLASECIERLRSMGVLHSDHRKRKAAVEAPAPVKKSKEELTKQRGLRVGTARKLKVCSNCVCFLSRSKERRCGR